MKHKEVKMSFEVMVSASAALAFFAGVFAYMYWLRLEMKRCRPGLKKKKV
jgi:hypothetical protein